MADIRILDEKDKLDLEKSISDKALKSHSHSEYFKKSNVKISKNNYIYSSNWSKSGDYYRAKVSDSSVNSNTVVDVNIHLNYLEEASDLLPVTQSYSGYFYIYAVDKPDKTIRFDYKILKEG